MKTLKVIILLLIAAAVLLCIGSLFLSPKFEISRAETIHAPHARVIHNLVDLSTWPQWWPWNQRGGELRSSTPRLDVGATFSWSARPVPGRLVVTESNIYAVRFDVFLDGKEAPLKGAFIMSPSADATSVTWNLAGEFETPVLAPYLAALADAQHGGMLSWGLRDFKQKVEQDKTPLELFYDDEAGKPVSEPVP